MLSKLIVLSCALLLSFWTTSAISSNDHRSPEDWRTFTERRMTGKLNNPEWMKQHEALVARAQSASPDVQFFGDSITAWISNGSLDAFRKNFPSAENFGIAGDVTEELMWRMTHGELAGNPKIIVVLIGTNDMTVPHPKSAHDIAVNIANIVRLIQTYEPTSKVLLMGILPRGWPPHGNPHALNRKLRQINAEVARLDDGNKVRFIDISTSFVDENGMPRADLLPDLLHPNHAGYQAWSDAIKPVINQMQKQ